MPSPWNNESDWSAVPDGVLEALDQLASRMSALENALPQAASDTPYTPVDGTDWVNPDPSDIAEAVDRLAAQVSVLGIAPVP